MEHLGGNYPDYDGFLRLRKWEGEDCQTTSATLYYQLKSVERLKKGEKYYCSRATLEKLIDPTSNVPALLFVVDRSTGKLYWYYFDEKTRGELKIDQDNKARTLELQSKQITHADGKKLNIECFQIIEQFGIKKKEYSLREIEDQYSKNAVYYLGLIYAFRIMERAKAPSIIADTLGVDKRDAEFILLKLIQEQILLATHNYYLVAEDEIGKQALSESIEKIDLDKLVADIKDHKQLLHLFTSLARSDKPQIRIFFRKVILELENRVKQENNDGIHRYLEYIEKFDHIVPNETLRIVRFLLKKKPLKPIIHKTRWGDYAGKSHPDLEVKIIEILDDIRYLKTKDVFKILASLSKSKEESVASKAFKSLESLTKYNLHALQHIGLNPQKLITEELTSWTSSKLFKFLDLVMVTAKQLFDASWEGTSMPDYQTFNIQWGALNATDTLKKLRLEIIRLLEKMYEEVKEVDTRLKLLKVLEDATKTPMRGRYSKDLEKMILENTNELVDWYLKKIKKMEPILLKEIEEQKEWFVQRYGRQRLPKIKRLEAALDSSKDYQYFRILVGDDHGFARKMNYTKIRTYREGHIEKFIKGISKKNIKEWTRRIITISSYSTTETRGSFNYFRYFLHRLCLVNPDFGLFLLERHEKELDAFIWPLILGICLSSKQLDGRSLLIKWIKRKKHLAEAAGAVQCFKVDSELIERIFEAAKDSDKIALNRLLESIGKIYKNNPERVLRGKFIACLKNLVKLKDTSAVRQAWLFAENLLQDLDEKDADVIVQALVTVPDVSDDADYTLKPIFQRFPEKLVQYFKMRVDYQKKKGERFSYMAVPFNHMHELAEAMKPHKDIIFDKLKTWFATNDWFDTHYGAQLLYLLFNLSDLEKEMLVLIRSKKDEDAKIAFAILHEAGRGALVSNLTKEFIKYHFDNKKWMSSLMASMSETGVVSGEDGLLNAYKRKRDTMQAWQKEKNTNVRKFAEEYEKSLNYSIADEQRRKDEELTLLKKGII